MEQLLKMENAVCKRATNDKKIKNTKSLTERLKNIQLQCSLNRQTSEKISNICAFKSDNENMLEYPKLRKPNPATFLKVQARQKTSDNNLMTVTKMDKKDESRNIEVPLRQEFMNKKEQLEKATSKLLKKYELRKSQGTLLDEGMFNTDPNEIHSLTLPTKSDLKFKKNETIITLENGSRTNKQNLAQSLNYCEQHLTNIFYAKVKAHPNGFFAENLPLWYKKTFEKNIPSDWLDLLRASNKFEIEKVQNKIVLYTKEFKEGDTEDFDVKNSDDKSVSDLVRFVRYKHLEKSLQKYIKSANQYKKDP